MKKALFLLLVTLLPFACKKLPVATRKPRATQTGRPPAEPAGKTENQPPTSNFQPLFTGAEQLPLYLPDLQGKRVAMVVNHTSLVGNVHLVDTLLRLGVKVNKIFAPEHGFRGDAANGEHVTNGVDTRSQLPIISLYGNNRKPTPNQLADVDAVIFDIQDVGTRFFTYISTMHYVMEACAENGKRLIVLDRPNPNGDYVDGPVLDTSLRSFIGMHPVPLVHGLTVGEMATMINGEKWLAGGRQCALKVVKNARYTHQTPYLAPQRPSPNLPNALAVRLYPSLCLFEGTVVSVGRGTDLPFLVIGAPDPRYGSYSFIPRSRPESKYPPNENQRCFGLNLSAGTGPDSFSGAGSFVRRPVEDSLFRFLESKKLTLSYLLDFYRKTPDKQAFFNANNFFDKLAGTKRLRQQIQSGMTEAQIRDTWQTELAAYRRLRANYLLYPD